MGRRIAAKKTGQNHHEDSSKVTIRSKHVYILILLLILYSSFQVIPTAFNDNNIQNMAADKHSIQPPHTKQENPKQTQPQQPVEVSGEPTKNESSETAIAKAATEGGDRKGGSSSGPTVQEVLCKNHQPANDPNKGQKLTQKLVEKIQPNFWISLHTRWFDLLRWNSIMDKGEYYETGLTDQFRQILIDQPKGLVIDVGMNIGWFTLYSRAMGHDIVGFDPNPIMHSRVCESLKLNNWQDDSSVSLYAFGLGDEVATLKLTTGKNPGKSSFHEDRLAPKQRKYIEVPVTTLDILASQKGWLDTSFDLPIHLLKVDVEGYEPQVFRGATNLIGSSKVRNIIFENSLEDLQLVSEMFLQLAQAGYSVHLISNVNGDPFHSEMIDNANKVLKEETTKATGGGEAAKIQGLNFFAKNSCNVWWKLTNPQSN